MATQPRLVTAHAGQDWLLSCAPDPGAIQRAWDAEEFAEFPTGDRWRVAEAPLTQSLTAMHRIGGDRLGPVLADVHRDIAWWLLPASVGDELDDIRRIHVHPAGWVLRCPPVLYSLEGRWWVERPDGSGRLTDPVLLGAAFGPGGYRTDAKASA
ncbi:hypothetical protein [Streptomyces sp. NPDC054834]